MGSDGSPSGTIGEISDGGRTITLNAVFAGIFVPGTFQKAISSSEAEYTYPKGERIKGYRFIGEDLMEAVLETDPPVKIKLFR